MGQAISFKDMFTKGLRNRDDLPNNLQLASLYTNFKATPQGGKRFGTFLSFNITPTADAETTPAYPFPQIFQGMGITLLFTANNVYTIDQTVVPATSTKHVLNDIYTPASTKAITGTDAWSFADFRTTWMAFNGASQVFMTKRIDETKTFVQDTVTIKSGCNFKQRWVFGGFDPTDFNTNWTTIWNDYIKQGLDAGLILSAPGKNWVGWGNIGGGDLLSLFIPSQVIDDSIHLGQVGFDADRPLFLETALRAEMGFMPMDFQGEVLNVVPMRDFVIVGGDDGVSALIPATSPVPTFGLREKLIPYGLMSRTSIGGSKDRLLLMDTKGVLWIINSNLSVERLGYEEFFAATAGNDVVITYDEDQDEFYLSSGTIGFILTKSGLSRCPERITAVGWANDGGNDHVGFQSGGQSTSPTLLNITSLPFDLGNRKPKTIASVEIQSRQNAGDLLKVQVDYRNDKAEAMQAGDVVTFNADGIAYIPLLTAVEFRVNITCDTAEDVDSIDDLLVNFTDGQKYSLKRLTA